MGRVAVAGKHRRDPPPRHGGRYKHWGTIVAQDNALWIRPNYGPNIQVPAEGLGLRAGLLQLTRGDQVSYTMKGKPKPKAEAGDQAKGKSKPKDSPKRLDRMFLEKFDRKPADWLVYCDYLATRLCPPLPGGVAPSLEASSAAACLHVLDNPSPILAVFERRDVWPKLLPLFAALRAMISHRSMLKRTKHLLSKISSTYMVQQLARGSSVHSILKGLSIADALQLSSHVVAIALEAKGNLSALCLALAG